MSLLDPGLALYVAAAVALLVWIALFIYLWMIDRQARELRRLLDQRRGQPENSVEPLRPVRRRVAEADSASERP